MRLRPRTNVIAAIAILSMATVAVAPLAGTASALPSEKSTCRASVVRLTTPLGTIEPTVVKNAAGQACTAQTKTFAGPVGVPGVISITIGAASTTVSGSAAHPVATAGLLNVSISPLLTLPAINLQAVLASTSAGGCTGQFGTPTSTPLKSSTGKIVGLSIGGQPIAVDGNPLNLNLFIATLSLNKVTTTANGITRQAFVLNVPVLGINLVISEAQSGFNGNPCDG